MPLWRREWKGKEKLLKITSKDMIELIKNTKINWEEC